jgi:hypothetical protein
MMRWLLVCAIAVAGIAEADTPKKKAEPSLSDQMADWRKQMGKAFDQLLDSVATSRKQLDRQPQEAGSVASQVGQAVDGISLNVNMALRTGMLRERDTIPTRRGQLTGPALLEELARLKREMFEAAVKYGDKAAKQERLAVLEHSYDWQQRQPAAMAAYEKAGRLRFAHATAKARVSEAARFERYAGELRKLGALSDTTQLATAKGKRAFKALLPEVKALAQSATKDQQRLAPLAAAEQQRADAQVAAAAAKAPRTPSTTTAKRPPAQQASTPRFERSVAAPLQTDQGEPEQEASPPPPPEEPPPAPRCTNTGGTCGNTNPQDDPCCSGSECVDRYQYSDGTLGIGHCS